MEYNWFLTHFCIFVILFQDSLSASVWVVLWILFGIGCKILLVPLLANELNHTFDRCSFQMHKRAIIMPSFLNYPWTDSWVWFCAWCFGILWCSWSSSPPPNLFPQSFMHPVIPVIFFWNTLKRQHHQKHTRDPFNPGEMRVIIPILQVQKPRFGPVQHLSQIHTAEEWQRLDLSSTPTPKPVSISQLMASSGHWPSLSGILAH